MSNLSKEQSLAALAIDAPICILAGAGSGKTRVITHRIAHLVHERGVDPRQILGVTFTNKAAREMRERVEKLLPDRAYEVLLGTFHGIAARFLRYYGDLVGVAKDFLIYDEDDAGRLIKKILKERYELSKDELNAEVKKILRFREADKNQAIKTAASERMELILELYQERLKKMGAVDFSGLLVKLCQLLEHEEGVRLISNRVRHLVVDEYQDINAVQAKIVHILAHRADSVAIVGDDDQSIYGWRGASAHFMQHFLKDFPSSKLYKLEDNYRSTKAILDAANALISNNRQRLGKTLRSMGGEGHLLRLKQHFRDNQEAAFVIEQAMRLFEQEGSYFSIAVLMRTNAQSRPLEEALHKARMPYRMVGGMRFYDRKEIKDILAALRAVIYQHSDIDLLRVLEALPLGIGKKTQEALSHYAGNHNLSFFETMADHDHQSAALANTRARHKISDFLTKLNNMRCELVQTLSDGEVKILRADEALIYIIDRFGIAAKLEQKNDDESEARLENIEQLVQAAVSFVEEAESLGQPSDAQAFLENVALISKDENVNDNTAKVGTVTLMTLHAAKGLEFDGVFLVGLEEGVLPHSRTFNASDENKRQEALEEERRLLYVGMTRAKKRLFLSYCQERFLHGKTSPSAPSRFVREIPQDSFEPGDRYLVSQQSRPDSSHPPFAGATSSWSRTLTSKTPSPNNSYRIEYENGHVGVANSGIKIGARVYHASYRNGRVISLSGSGSMTRAQVRFEGDNQVRMIMLTHLQLQQL